MSDEERAKRQAASRAVKEVEDGMVVGLGSGSTAAHAIREIGDLVDAGTRVVGVPTSHQAASVARETGVPVRCLADVSRVDLAIDGADQVAGMDLIKGGGGAHAREKVIAAAAARFIVVIDESKVSDVLDQPVPVEVLPDARTYVETQIRDLEGTPTLRSDGFHRAPRTDNGNHILDCSFGTISDVENLDRRLASIPGVVEHGIFCGMVDRIYVGSRTDARLID